MVTSGVFVLSILNKQLAFGIGFLSCGSNNGTFSRLR